MVDEMLWVGVVPLSARIQKAHVTNSGEKSAATFAATLTHLLPFLLPMGEVATLST